MNEEAKKERPQNKNLRPLGSDRSTPERDAAIHKKGGPSAARAHRRNVALTEIVRAVAFLGTQPEKTEKGRAKDAVDVFSLKNISEIDEKNIPQIVLVVQAQFIKAQKGDIEARDWICKMLGVDPKDMPVFPHLEGSSGPPAPDGGPADGVTRYHLIRGEKPADPDSMEDAGEDEATRASREAIAAAMSALEAAAGDGGTDG